MKSLINTINEKLRITNNSEDENSIRCLGKSHNIKSISSSSANMLTVCLRCIPFELFKYVNYITNFDYIEIDKYISYEFRSSYSNLKDLLPKFLNIILSQEIKTKRINPDYLLEDVLEKINKYLYKDEGFYISLEYKSTYEDYEIVFNLYQNNKRLFSNILKIELECI